MTEDIPRCAVTETGDPRSFPAGNFTSEQHVSSDGCGRARQTKVTFHVGSEALSKCIEFELFAHERELIKHDLAEPLCEVDQ